jgi:hypothetical protein
MAHELRHDVILITLAQPLLTHEGNCGSGGHIHMCGRKKSGREEKKKFKTKNKGERTKKGKAFFQTRHAGHIWFLAEGEGQQIRHDAIVALDRSRYGRVALTLPIQQMRSQCNSQHVLPTLTQLLKRECVYACVWWIIKGPDNLLDSRGHLPIHSADTFMVSKIQCECAHRIG